MFKGSIVALVTPFKNGKVDEKRLSDLVEFQIKEGTDAILPCGCTGEAATLEHEEQIRIIQMVVEMVKKRVKVVGGTGSNSTEEALHLTQGAKKVGADGALMITPYYNKPTPQGLYEHYSLIAKKVDIPIILYNVPSRTGISILPETVAELSKIENIVAIKEASGSLDQVSQILSLCALTVLSGDDSLTLPMMVLGAKGVVSVAANVMPGEVKEMVRAALDGKWDKARELHFELLPLFKAMFIEVNPQPVKTALALMGKIEMEWRLPLTKMREESMEKLKKVLKGYKLI